MTDTKIDHSPVDIGSGSFDADKLQKAVDAAAKAKAEDKAEVLEKGLASARADGGAVRDNAGQPGFEKRTVEREIAPGVTVTETISVFVGDGEPEKAKPVASKQTAASSAADKGSN